MVSNWGVSVECLTAGIKQEVEYSPGEVGLAGRREAISA